MPAILANPYKRAAAKYRPDRNLSYSPATSASVPTGSVQILVINQGSKGWTVPTTAFALVLIALATLVGGAMTTWHYWNEEQRAAQAEQQTARQRHLDWWKAEMQRAQGERQQHRELTESRVKARLQAFVTPLPAAQEQEHTESHGSSAGIVMLTGSNTAAVGVPDSGQLGR